MQTFPRYRLNARIFAPELRIIGETGEQLGILSRQEALIKAYDLGVDLVEIAPNAKPPVAKMIDFKKFLYQESKKKRKSGGKAKSGDVKEVWLTPFIANHDLESRINRGKTLLQESGKLKIVMRFRRAEMLRKHFGEQTLQKFLTGLGEIHLEKPPHFEGNRLVASVSKK